MNLRNYIQLVRKRAVVFAISTLVVGGGGLIFIGYWRNFYEIFISAGVILWMFAGNLLLYNNLRKHMLLLHKSNKAILSAISLNQIGLREPTTFLNHAAYPDFIELVLEMVRRNRPGSILELGSGSSTRYLVAYLQEIGSSATVLSMEDDQEWVALVDSELQRLNHHMDANKPFRKVLHAPLSSVGSYQLYQYDEDILKTHTPFDLVIVDGPHNVRDRVQFLSQIEDFLSDDVIVIFDDANMDEIQQAIHCYKTKGWAARYYDTFKGTWMMWKKSKLRMPSP